MLLLYRLQRIFDEGLVRPGLRVLDVGGWGVLATALIEAGCETTILDKFTHDQYYPERVRALPHKVGDVLDMGCFPAATFDLVTCFETLEHVRDIETAVYNMTEWLKRGGWIVGTIALPGGVHAVDDPACVFIDAEALAAMLAWAGCKAVVEPTPSAVRGGKVTSLYFKGQRR